MKKLTALLTLFCLITTVLSGCVLPVEETTDTETETTAETVTVTETETETETEEIKQDEKMKIYFISSNSPHIAVKTSKIFSTPCLLENSIMK